MIQWHMQALIFIIKVQNEGHSVSSAGVAVSFILIPSHCCRVMSSHKQTLTLQIRVKALPVPLNWAIVVLRPIYLSFKILETGP